MDRHLLPDGVDDLGPGGGAGDRQRGHQVRAVLHQPHDVGGAFGVACREVPQRGQRDIEVQLARGLDRQRFVVGDAGARQRRRCGARRPDRAPSRRATVSTARSATPRAVVYFSPEHREGAAAGVV